METKTTNYPAREPAAFEYYQDDGISIPYQVGQFATTRFTIRVTENGNIEVGIGLLCVLAFLPKHILRNIARAAGCHVFTDFPGQTTEAAIISGSLPTTQETAKSVFLRPAMWSMSSSSKRLGNVCSR